MKQSPESHESSQKIKVLFVCMGNICRSPSAEAIFHNMVLRAGFKNYVEVASAGTHDYHVGEPADRRSHKAAANRGVALDHHRAQHLKREDFAYYDYILLMDHINHDHVTRICPSEHLEKVHYLMDFAPQLGVKEVPDPYHGGPDAFEHVLDLVEAAAAGLLADIRERRIDPANPHPEINV